MPTAIGNVLSQQASPAVSGASVHVSPESQFPGVEASARIEQSAFTRIERPLDAAATQVLGERREAAAELNSKLQDLGAALDNIATAQEELQAPVSDGRWQPIDPTDSEAMQALAEAATITVSYAGSKQTVVAGPAVGTLRALSTAMQNANGGSAWRHATGTATLGEGLPQPGIIRSGDAEPIFMSDAIKAFATSYNEAQDALAESDFHVADESAQGLSEGLDSAVSATYSALPEGAQSLEQVGIQPSAEGRLEVDEGRLAQALVERPGDVVSLFSSDAGPGGAIRAALSEVYVDPVRGSLSSGGLEPSIRQTEESLQTVGQSLQGRQEELSQHATELESAVQEVSETRSFLRESLGI